MIALREGGIDDPQVTALLRLHRVEASASTTAENAHAFDAEGLALPDVRFVSAWQGEALLGVGALRALSADHAEIKSTRTHPAHLRKGVDRAMLAHLVGLARGDGCRRVSLETGTAPMFAAANAMYESHGFVDGPPFGGYPPSPHNRFMTLLIEEPPCPPSS